VKSSNYEALRYTVISILVCSVVPIFHSLLNKWTTPNYRPRIKVA